jgi:hypothetical protein
MVGTLVYTVIADNGCAVDTATVEVTAVADDTKIVIEPADTVLCEPQEICLEAIAPLAECVIWTDLEGNPLDTGAQLCIFLETGIHTFIAFIPDLDCVEADTVVIKVLPDSLSLSIGLSAEAICEGEEVALTAIVEPDWTMEDVTWYDSDFNLIGSGGAITLSPSAGVHTFIAIAENECVADTAQATIVVERLDLQISVEPEAICPDEQALLRVTGCNNCDYEWAPTATLDDPFSSSPIATPLVTTTYNVTVTGEACVEVLSATVTVEDCPDCEEKFFVATGFKPDGQPKDISSTNVTCLRSEYLEDFEEIYFIIYSRWGQEVFRYDYKKGESLIVPEDLCWDGRLNGTLLPPDVYGFYVRVKCPDRDAIDRKGNITLLR